VGVLIRARAACSWANAALTCNNQERAAEHFSLDLNISRLQDPDDIFNVVVHGTYLIDVRVQVLKKLFETRYFNINLLPDVAGAEMCGTLKNIVALAAGMVDGLGLGPNSKATIMRQVSGLGVQGFFCQLQVARVHTCAVLERTPRRRQQAWWMGWGWGQTARQPSAAGEWS
jgi:hypothetical protein